MGLLERTDPPQRLAPGARCLVGRAGTAGLQLEDRSVSAEHASLFWTGDGWAVRDLGSRNGTYVGDRRLGAGEKVDLSVGDVLRFGGAGDWVLRHAGPPTAMAAPVSHAGRLDLEQVRVADRDLLALPDEEDPDVTVRREGDHWVVEEEEKMVVADEVRIQAAGRPWVILVPPDEEQVGATTAFSAAPRPVLADAELLFGVSADEEHVELTVRLGAQSYAVKPRTHHYLLLTLARQRLEDVDAGVDDAEAGWLHAEDLQKMLRMDRRALNTQVFRARKQLAALDLDGGGDIIERRDPARQLRIGPSKIQVDRIG